MKKIMVMGMMFFGLCISVVSATEQIPETLIYKGQKLALFDLPLEALFSEENPKPFFSPPCTAAYRGYGGTWELKDDGYLYLVELLDDPCGAFGKSNPVEEDPQLLIKAVFRDQKLPIKAAWVDRAIHALFNEKMLELVFKNGELVDEKVMKWPKSKYDAPLFKFYWDHGCEF